MKLLYHIWPFRPTPTVIQSSASTARDRCCQQIALAKRTSVNPF